MKKRTNKNKPSKISLLGIPIILIGVVAYLFVSNYEPKYENVPFDTIIYSSDRYSESQTAGWHKIDFSSFSIEVPDDYHFYLEQGAHGGKVGGLTDSKDTVRFVHGAYYFDACEGIVIGEIIGTCDTLGVFKSGTRNLILARTDAYINAFSKDPRNDYVFKAWANLDVDRNLLLEMFRTVKFNE